jgi:hypothetical protein
MPQVFGRRSVTALRAGLMLAVIAVPGAIIALRSALGYASALGPRVGEPPAQPVPFSHAHHVGEIGLDCRYCHSSVETSASAGYPATQVCMTCHSVLFQDEAMLEPVRASWNARHPLRWQRINDLPDFVYFDHSVHVANGVGCVSCHGRIDRMPLTWRTASLEMQWCLDCHRNPAPQLRTPDRIFDLTPSPSPDANAEGARLLADYRIDTRRLTECSTCHR